MPGRRALSKVAPRSPAILQASPSLNVVRAAAADAASVRSRNEAAVMIARWITDAFHPAIVEVRVVLQDRKGNLRVAARSSSEKVSSDLRSLRRVAIASKRTARADVEDPPASAIAIPLVAADQAFGVLEIVAGRGEIESRWGVIDCLASLAAAALRGVSRTDRSATRDVGPERETGPEVSATPSSAWMAHEVRTPLIVARATVERVIATEPSDENRALLERSRAHLERLMETVDRILDWACGGLAAGRHPVDLATVARSAVVAASAEGGVERVRLSVPDHLVILGDDGRLEIAVTNLIRNALKYSPQRSRISVTVERSGGWASLRVDDEGPGVAVEERDLIFAPLVRGRAGRGDDSGRGLGLFMARQVVEELGGSIWVESVGTGSSFRFLLPIPGKGEVPSGS